MRRSKFVATMKWFGAFCVTVAFVAPASAGAAPACVPYTPLDFGAFREGVVDGAWLGAILMYGGGNGEAFSARLFTSDDRGAVQELETIRTYDGGDKMNAFFFGGKLYLENADYLHKPYGGHCCPSHLAVQRFGLSHGKLLHRGVALVPTPAYSPAPGEKDCITAELARWKREMQRILPRATYR